MRWLALFAWFAVSACTVSSEVSRELGARCDDSDECDDRCLIGARFPDGFCSASCDSDSDCPSGASCVDLEGGTCLYACGEAVGCEFLGQGWGCVSEPERGADPGSEVMVCIGQP